MTITDAQTERAAILAAITAITQAGAKQYDISAVGGRRSVTKLDLPALFERMAQLDQFIDRYSNGMFSVMQTRPGTAW